MKVSQIAVTLLLSATCLQPTRAQEAPAPVSNADLARKLDLILLKVDALDKRVSELESQRAATSSAPSTPAPAAPAPTPVVPEDPKEKQNFFQKLRNELKSEEIRASGPWTNPDVWLRMRRNMSEFQVRTLLGLPTKVKNSINPRIDRVYRYEGDLDADGEIERGIVNFFRGRVTSFEKP